MTNDIGTTSEREIGVSLVDGESTVRHTRQLMLRSEGYAVRSYPTCAAILAAPRTALGRRHRDARLVHRPKGGRYAYYTCNDKVNRGGKCNCPNIRREVLDDMVLYAIEGRLLERDRLRGLLAGVFDVSHQRTQQREAELARAQAERTRLITAIKNLLILV
ncbi:zinc ribbon domain-containing protein [Sphingomonas qilianensis]|uniref:Zinc ribbon domain-containing protein n=1 Tax=Sphingomonas qilianensis TaxID=1736690 RepID=A0ABU9XQI0_9SPHN